MAENMRHPYTVGVYEKAFPESLTVQEMLVCAREAGYDFFEISIDRTDQRIGRLYSPEFEDSLKSTDSQTMVPVYSMGLSAIGTYTLGSPDPAIVEKGMDIFYHAVDFSERTGIRIIQIPACDTPKFDPRDEETDARFIRNLKTAVEYAASHAVILGLENMENDYMDSVGKCMRILREVDSPYLQLYPDSGNTTNAWKNDREAILHDMERGKGHYLAFHEKEVQPTRYGGLFYGDGHVDFGTLTKKAYDLGARRFVMEYWYTGNPEWKQDLKTARSLCDDWISAEEKY